MEKKHPPYPMQPPTSGGIYPAMPQPLSPNSLPGGSVLPPAPPPYESQPPPPVGVTTTTSVLVGTQPSVHFGPESQALSCPHCHAQIITKVESKASTKTHLLALLLCCCICWPCAWMPYCMDSCQNRNHSCPNCGAYLGTYEN